MPIETLGPLPESKRALVLFGKEDLRYEDRPIVMPSSGEVLLKVGSVGVCGSDKHFFHDGRASSDVMTDPIVMGHEFGGQIVATGPGVLPTRLGDRVSVEPLVPDWSSREARIGRYNIDPTQKFFGVPDLDGGLQQYLVVPSANAHLIPDSVSDDAAAMVETISVALNGVRKARAELGSRILVAGGGPVGIFVAQLALLHGAAEVVVVEPNSDRRKFCAGLGCDVVTDLTEVNQLYDAFIDCTGVDSVRHDGFFSVLPGGRAVFIGVGSNDATIPMPAVIEREVSLHGVMRYAFTWPAVIQALAAGRIQTDDLVTRRLVFADAINAWTKPLASEVKAIIRVNE